MDVNQDKGIRLQVTRETPILLALGKIAGALNGRHLVWGIGGSTLLSLYGIVDFPQDLDLLVALDDVDEAMKAILALPNALLQERSPSTSYFSAAFVELTVDGIDVDMIAGFTIKLEGGSLYTYPFGQAQIEGYASVNGYAVPLTPLKDWEMLYGLMPNRQERVEQIARYRGHRGRTHMAF